MTLSLPTHALLPATRSLTALGTCESETGREAKQPSLLVFVVNGLEVVHIQDVPALKCQIPSYSKYVEKEICYQPQIRELSII